jgi:hypothetical protein
VVHAHHADPKDEGGARHAGNLTLLCKLHHDNSGRRLTRAAVTAALRKRTREVYPRFGADGGSGEPLVGRAVEVTVPDYWGDSASLFFTREHAEY